MKLEFDFEGIYWKLIFVISLLFKLLFPQRQIRVLQLLFIFYFFLQQIQCQMFQLLIYLHKLCMIVLLLIDYSHAISQSLLYSWVRLVIRIYFSIQLFNILQFFAILSYYAIFFLQYLMDHLLMLLMSKQWFLNRIFLFIFYHYFLKFICFNFYKNSIKDIFISFEDGWQFIFELVNLSIINSTHSDLLWFKSACSMFKDERYSIVGIYRKLIFILRVQSIYSMKRTSSLSQHTKNIFYEIKDMKQLSLANNNKRQANNYSFILKSIIFLNIYKLIFISSFCLKITKNYSRRSFFFVFFQNFFKALTHQFISLIYIIMKIDKASQEKFYIYPPNEEKCQIHYLATRIFKGIDENNLNKQCQCCERKVGNQQQPCHCCYGNLQLAFLGPGIPLFFTFLRNVIIYLIILSIIFSIFGLFSNISSKNCEQSQNCNHNIFNTLSIVNKANELNYLSIQNYILLVFVVLSVFILQIFRYNFRKIEQQCDLFVHSPSDYAIILRRLPPQVTKQDIQKLIQFRKSLATQEEKSITDNLQIVNIVLSYHLSDWLKVKEENIQQFKKYAKSQQSDKKFKPKQLPVVDKTGTFAIVIFSKQQTKNLFIDEGNIFQKLLYLVCTPCIPRSDFTIKDQYVAIQRAPQPDDIIWENASVSISGSIFRRFIWNIIAVILLIIGALIQLGLAVLQTKLSNNTHIFIISTASSILVSITNAILQQFIIFSTYKERSETQSELYTALTIKISFFQFLNAGVFIVIAKILANAQNFSLQGQLASEVTQIMIVNAITPSVGTFILYYFNIFGKIKRCLIRRDTLTRTQLEANIDWELAAPQIPYKYSYIIKTIWLTAFYAPLAPIVVPISIFGLIFYYIVERILYGNAYRAPNMLSDQVNNSAIDLLQWFTLILSFGQFLIYFYFKSFQIDAVPAGWSATIFISLGLSIINMFMPMKRINQKCIKLKSDDSVWPRYSQVEDKFEVTYQMSNPIIECRRKRKRDRFLWHSLFGQDNNVIQLENLLGQNSSKGMMQPLINNSPTINRSNGNNSGNIFQALGAGRNQYNPNNNYNHQPYPNNSNNGYQPNFQNNNNYNPNYQNNYPTNLTYDPPSYGADQYIYRGINQGQNQFSINPGNPFTQLLNHRDRL